MRMRSAQLLELLCQEIIEFDALPPELVIQGLVETGRTSIASARLSPEFSKQDL